MLHEQNFSEYSKALYGRRDLEITLYELPIENFKLLLDEGSAILKSEFGGEYKSFYTVMEAISLGKTKLNEIAAFFSNDLNKAN